MLAAAVPVITSVLSLVRRSPTVPVSSLMLVMVRPVGAAVSTVHDPADTPTDRLPAMSIAFTLRLCCPSDSALLVML